MSCNSKKCNNKVENYINLACVDAEPFEEAAYLIGMDEDKNPIVVTPPDYSGIQEQIDGKVSKAGDTMTGALILNDDAANMLGATTLQQVNQLIADSKTDSFQFKGFISSVAPSVDIREGNYWLNTSLAPGENPPTEFPLVVSIYTNGVWSDANVSYTPSALDLWSDIDNNEGWYYLGDTWERLDFSGSAFNSSQFNVVDGVVSLKAGGITNTEIAANAAIAISKIANLQTLLNSKQNNLISGNQEVILTPQPDGTTKLTVLDGSNFERRITIHMETPDFDMFFSEDTIINRVDGLNVSTLSITIDGVTTEIQLNTDNVNYLIPAGKIAIFTVTGTLTNPTSYLYMIGETQIS